MSFLRALVNRRKDGGGGAVASLILAGLILGLAGTAWGAQVTIGSNDTVVVFNNDGTQFGDSGEVLSVGSDLGLSLDGTGLLGGIVDGVIGSVIDTLGLGALDVNPLGDGLVTTTLRPLITQILTPIIGTSDIDLGVLSAGGGGGLGGGGGGGLLAGGGGYGGGAGGLFGGSGGGLNVGRSDILGGDGGLLLDGDKGGIGGGGSGLLGLLSDSQNGGNGGGTAGGGQNGGTGSVGGGLGGGNYDLTGTTSGAGGDGFGGGGGSHLDLDQIVSGLLGMVLGEVTTALKDPTNQGLLGGLVTDLGKIPLIGTLVPTATELVDAILGGVTGPLTTTIGGTLTGSLTSGLGSALNLGGLLGNGSALAVAGGGGGGITEGGQGFGLLENGGGGGSLGITADHLNIDTSANATTVADQRYHDPEAGDTYVVNSGGSLVVFGGSGGGGGLVLSLLSDSSDMDGIGADVANVTVNTGGEVTLLGGTGGGGGLILGADGGDGFGATAKNITIAGGTVNVTGGAGAGANVTLLALDGLTATKGGQGTGAVLDGGSMSAGTLNIFAGADGGDITTQVLGLVGITDLLDLGDGTAGQGGAGGGGTVKNYTFNGGTMNISAGTNEDDLAKEIAGTLDVTKLKAGGQATAENITNNGGTINLRGGQLTGTYTQSKGTLNLSGGAYAVAQETFSGGRIAVETGGTEVVADAIFTDTAASSGQTYAYVGTLGADGKATGAGSLTLSGATINTGADVVVGNNVTIDLASENKGALTILNNGALTGAYSQTDAASALNLGAGADLSGANIAIGGGSINAIDGAVVLEAGSIDITGTVNTTGGNHYDIYKDTASANDATNAQYHNDGGGLTIVNANVGGSANLTVGTNVTLRDTTFSGGVINMSQGNSFISGSFTQSVGSTLNLNGSTAANTANAEDMTFNGGTINSQSGDSIFTIGGIAGTSTFDITGEVDATVNGGTSLTLVKATVTGSGGILNAGDKVTLQDVTATAGGTVNLASGSRIGETFTNAGGTLNVLEGAVIDGAYTQSAGGTLALNNTSVGATANGSITITDGFVQGAAGNSTLNGATFNGTGSVITTAAAGAALAIAGTTIDSADIVVSIGPGVTLSGSTLADGTLNIRNGGGIAGTYTQDGGSLSIQQSTKIAADAVLDLGGGTVSSTDSATLAGKNLSITGGVTISNLTVAGIGGNITKDGNLILGSGGILGGDTNFTTGMITLGAGGSLAGNDFKMGGGMLVLAGGSTGSGKNTITGGAIESQVAGQNLTADFTSGNITTQTNGGTSTLTVTGTVSGTANLTVDSGVTLGSMHTGGTVTLAGTGNLGAGYTLDGGTLSLAGGANTAAGANFIQGSIVSTADGSTLTGGTFNGAAAGESVKILGDGGTITVTGITIGSTGNIALGSGATLDAVTGNHTAGFVTLEGGQLGKDYVLATGGTLNVGAGTNTVDTAAQFTGGTIAAIVKNATLTGGTITNSVTTAVSDGMNLILKGTTIGSGATAGNLSIGSGVTLDSGNLAQAGSTITLASGGNLSGAYTQTAGTLILNGGNTSGASGVTLSGGSVESRVGNGSLADMTIDGTVNFTTSGAGSKLTLSNADITGLANLIINSGVTLADATLDSADAMVTLETGGALSGRYTQNDGTLQLENGDTSGATSVTLAGGTVTSTGGSMSDLKNAEVTGEVTANASGAGSGLTITGVNILEGGILTAEAGVALVNTSVKAGILDLVGGVLKGTFDLAGGTLNLAGGTIDAATKLGLASGFITGTADFTTADRILTISKGEGVTAGGSGSAITAEFEILDGGNLTLLDGATMAGGAMTGANGSTSITLDGGTLEGFYEQNGGTLFLGELWGGMASGQFDPTNGMHFIAGILNNLSNYELILDLANIDIEKGFQFLGNISLEGDLGPGESIDIGDGGSYHGTLDGGTVNNDGGTVDLAAGSKDGTVNLGPGDGDSRITSDPGVDVGLALVTTEGPDTNGSIVAGDGGTITTKELDMTKGGNMLSGAGSIVLDAVQKGGELIAGALDRTLNEDGGFDYAYVDGAESIIKHIVTDGGLLLAGAGVTIGDGVADTVDAIVNGGTFVAGSLDGNGEVVRNAAGDIVASVVETVQTADSGFLAGVGSSIDHAIISGDSGGAGFDSVIGAFDGAGKLVQGGFASIATLDAKGGNEILAGVNSNIGTAAIDGSALVMGALDATGKLAAGVVDAAGNIDWNEAKKLSSHVDSVNVTNGGLLVANIGSSIGSATLSGGSQMQVDSRFMMSGRLDLRTNTMITFAGAGGISYIGEIGSENAKTGGILNFNVSPNGIAETLVVGHSSGTHTLAFSGVAPGGTVNLLYDLTFSGDSYTGATYKSPTENILHEEGALLLRTNVSWDDTTVGAALTDLGITLGELKDYLNQSFVNPTGVPLALAADLGLSRADAQALAANWDTLSEDQKIRLLKGSSRAVGMSQSAEGIGNAAAIGLSQANVGMFELGRHFRVLREANQSWKNDNCLDPTTAAIWASTYTHHISVDAIGNATMNLWGLDIGFDKQFDGFANGTLYLGAVAGGQWLSNFSVEQRIGRDGEGSGKAFSLGGYAAWMNNDGWYVNAALRHFWSDLEMTSFSPTNSAINYNPSRNAFALSVEAGRKYDLSEAWYVEPSVGLMGTLMTSDSFRTSAGHNIDYGTTKSLEGTAGVALGYNGQRFMPYVEAALVHAVNGKTNVTYDGHRYTTDPSGTRFRGSLGASYYLSGNVSLSLEAAYEKGSGFSDVNGNFGVNFSW